MSVRRYPVFPDELKDGGAVGCEQAVTVVLASDYDALEAALTNVMHQRNDECRLRQGAEARYAEDLAALAEAKDQWKVQRDACEAADARIVELEEALTAIIAEVQNDGSLMKCAMIADAALLGTVK